MRERHASTSALPRCILSTTPAATRVYLYPTAPGTAALTCTERWMFLFSYRCRDAHNAALTSANLTAAVTHWLQNLRNGAPLRACRRLPPACTTAHLRYLRSGYYRPWVVTVTEHSFRDTDLSTRRFCGSARLKHLQRTRCHHSVLPLLPPAPDAAGTATTAHLPGRT